MDLSFLFESPVLIKAVIAIVLVIAFAVVMRKSDRPDPQAVKQDQEAD